MPTIYKANSDRINIADAKRLILEALPVSSEVWGVVSGHLGEDGEPEWDIESLESESAADATESCIHQDFMKICQRLGFEPHLILSPARGGYIASEANDKLYMLTHAEFVQVADSYSLPVAIGTAPEQADTQPQPAPVEAAEAQPDSITSRQVATFFDSLPYTAENWPKRLSDTKWLQPAKIALGEVGGITGLWCPLILARLIHGRDKGRKQKTLEALNNRFKRNPALQPWRDAWNEHYALFTDAIDD